MTTDNISQQKLISHCGQNLLPYNITYQGIEFTVSVDRIYEDIKTFVGLECIVHVKIIPFCFPSKFANNTSQIVSGTRLVLDNIIATGQ